MELSDEMQEQAKALADPSRFRVFRHIAEADQPVGVAELTELMGFHHNAIRQHLKVLVDIGFVTESVEERTVVGRPRKQYEVRMDAMSAFGPVFGSYKRLAFLLLEIIKTGDTPYDVGFRSSEEDRKTLEQSGRLDPVGESLEKVLDALIRRLAVEGFEPEFQGSTVTLAHCPFAAVAAGSEKVVCELHRGLIDGYLAGEVGNRRGELTVRNPHSAGCAVRVLDGV